MDIQKMKNYILDLAIKGKLVLQDASDEPAGVLLERIKKEKQQLVKEGKIKKEKDLLEITESEMPFEIPSSWEWVRLGDVVKQVTDGTHKTPTYVEEGIPFLSVQNISSGKFNLNKIKYISNAEHNSLITRCKPEKNDLLLCRIGTLGKAIVINIDFEFSIFVSLALIKPIKFINSEYLKHTCNSNYGTEYINAVKVGGGSHTAKINLNDIPNMLIPLPPLEEQKRIVEKVEELFGVLDNLEKEIADYDKYIKMLNKKVLDLAIRGKLVKQNKNDEPASVLLEKIKKEKQQLIKEGKIKKEKDLPTIMANEIPFEIPSSWEWVRLGDVFNITSSKRVFESEWTREGIPFYRAREIAVLGETGVINNSLFITNEMYEKYKKLYGVPGIEDIMVTGVGTLGKTYIVKDKDKFYFKDGNIIWYKNFGKINAKYIKSLYESSYIINFINANCNGTTVNTYTIINAKNTIIPLSPLEEQRRIVEKIKEITSIIEGIQQIL